MLKKNINILSKLILLALIILAPISQVSARSAPESFADLVDQLMPSVVNISTTQTVDGAEANPFGNLFSENMPGGTPFGDLPGMLERFYGFKTPDQAPSRKATSLGSGFIIDPAGFIVTNYHVVNKADEIIVTFSDGTKEKAKVVGKDKKTDLALLKIESKKKLPAVKWGDSEKARVGDWVIAIGNPFGLGGSVSAGIISARARDINSGPFDDFIQTDAAINRGNSGGPLFDSNGKVIGINAAIFSTSGGNIGIGFAIPSSMAWSVIKQLKEEGKTHRGWLGVKIQTVTEEIAESLGLKSEEGALVLEVTKDSPADKAGVLAGDIILTFDDKHVKTMRKLPRIVAQTKPGKKVPMTILRKSKKKTLLVSVQELKEDDDNDGIKLSSKKNKKQDKKIIGTSKFLGMEVADLNDDLRGRFNIASDIKGIVVVAVDLKTNAAQKGIRKGDVINAINQENITKVKDASEIIKQAKKLKRKSALLLVNRAGNTRFIAISIDK